MKKEKSVRRAEWKAAAARRAKSLIVPVILLAVIAAFVFVILNYKNEAEPEEIVKINAYEGSSEPIVMENDQLKFTMDPTTTQFCVEVKETGKVWYSNPEGGADDPIALTSEKGKLMSTLSMSYSVTAGLETQYNNYDYSIKNGIYEIETGEDYVRVNYSVGDTAKEFLIPPVTTQTQFDDWTASMDKTALNMVKQYYKKYDINKLGKKDDKEQLLLNYPILETEVIYVLRDNASDSVKKKMEEYFEAAGYTLEAYAADKELDHSQSTSDKPVFNMNMIYRLDGKDLVVELPLGELEYKEEYPIYTLSILPYFGAGDGQDEGYLLVPEGGGAIIRFNNGKLSQNGYYANVYGWDMALSREAVVHDTRTYFNTFGISVADDSFLCILEEGAPYASIRADVSGHNNSYNYANALYSICVREKYEVGDIANSDIYVYLEDLPDETLTQRYRFVDSGSYADMAAAYREYLLDQYGGYLSLREEEGTPVALEIVGAVDKVKQILGVPVSRPLKLTSFAEAADMIGQLKQEGMDNISVKLTGWCNGGVNQKILNSVRPISSLGGKKGLKELAQAAQDLGVDLYLEGVTQYEYDSNLLNGFNSFTDAAKFLSKERAELFVYSDVTYAAREGIDSYYLLHTDLALEMAQNLSDAAGTYGTGVALRDTGMDLSSDYYRKKPSSRQNTLYRQAEQLKAMADAGRKVMVNMGNDYAMPYCDIITDMDLRGSEYTIVDDFVPFYQMAIHGYVDYTGAPVNTGDTQERILLAAEYGAGLNFSLMRETAFALQKTLYTEYYASDFAAWHDRMMEIYNRYDAQLGHVFGQKMTGHEKIGPEVSCTVYEDGTKVYVNYSYEDAETPEGGTVPARDYMVVR